MSSDLREVIEHGDVIVVGNKDDAFAAALEQFAAGRLIIDLARLGIASLPDGARYDGICW